MPSWSPLLIAAATTPWLPHRTFNNNPYFLYDKHSAGGGKRNDGGSAASSVHKYTYISLNFCIILALKNLHWTAAANCVRAQNTLQYRYLAFYYAEHRALMTMMMQGYELNTWNWIVMHNLDLIRWWLLTCKNDSFIFSRTLFLQLIICIDENKVALVSSFCYDY